MYHHCNFSKGCSTVCSWSEILMDYNKFQERIEKENPLSSRVLLASGYSNGILRITDLGSMQQIHSLQPHSAPVLSTLFMPNGIDFQCFSLPSRISHFENHGLY